MSTPITPVIYDIVTVSYEDGQIYYQDELYEELTHPQAREIAKKLEAERVCFQILRRHGDNVDVVYVHVVAAGF